MSKIQEKTTHHTTNQENLKLNEKRQSTDTNTETTQMLELSDKHFKADAKKYFSKQLPMCLKQI